MLTGWAFVNPVASKADVYLVSVGIADYPGTRNDLHRTTNDAIDIYNLYKGNSHAHARLLIDKQATLVNIESTMKDLYKHAKPEDIVVFFFSGHGTNGDFVAYDGSLPYKKIREAMAISKSLHKMIFADACHSGKMRQGKNNAGTQQAMKQLEVMLFLSSRSNEYSIEYENMRNGIFTNFLLKGLKGYADSNKDRIITAKELFNYVSREVKRESNNRQHPVMWGKFSDDMPVMCW